MPLLYKQTLATTQTYILRGKINRPLTPKEIQRLENTKPLMEKKANVLIRKIETTPTAIQISFTPKTQSFFIPIIWAIAAIAIAIGIPITTWFVLQAPAPGPLGLPQWFWVGLGVGIPLFGLATVIWMTRRK